MITEGKRKKVVLLAFNLGVTGGLVNGPGISLRNLITFAESFCPNISFSIFTSFPVTDAFNSCRLYDIGDSKNLKIEIARADVVHLWSGLRGQFVDAVIFANKLSKPVIIGPNLLDAVDALKERALLSDINFDMLLTANPRLKYLLAKTYNISHNKIRSFMVGPDLDIWQVPRKVDEYILWKGNAKEPVKDVRFAKRVKAELSEYKFLFMGADKRFGYKEHVLLASQARLYINTSLSETKGMAQLEQMAAGVPSVVHPKVYSHGENYVTGIITNRTVGDYVDAIREILTNNELRKMMRVGARKYVEKNYNPKDIAISYLEIIEHVS